MLSTPNSWCRWLGAVFLAAHSMPSPVAAQDQEGATAAPANAEANEAPFELTVVGGDPRLVTANPIGQPLSRSRFVCLDRLQTLVVAARGEEIRFDGPGCLEPRTPAQIPDAVYAGSHVWQPLSEDSPRWSDGGESAIVLSSSGPSAETFPPGQRVAEDMPIILLKGDRLTLLEWPGPRVLVGPGTFSPVSRTNSSVAAARSSRTRGRFGAVRGFGAEPVVDKMIAIRGTPGALRKFPRGTLFASPHKVCLAAGDQLTLARRSGASLTLAGPGCGRLLDGTAADNTAAVSPG